MKNIIREKRKELGLSQEELVKGMAVGMEIQEQMAISATNTAI